MKAVRITAGLAVVLTYGLIVLGALVRSTESGLSCPDWPTCYGHWVLTPADYATLPDTGYTYVQIMLEWVHRLVAGVILGPLVLLLSALVFARAGKYPTLAWAAALLILLLVVQAGLGRFTVLDQNSPWSVALHLGTALLVFTTMLFLFVRSREAPTRAPAVGLLSALAWVTALAAMLTAAVTAKSGASLACATWPLCDGAIVPDLSDPLVRIHVAHRALAAATGVLILLLAVVAARTPCRAQALVALLLVAGQIALGAVLIRLQVPTWAAVLHQAVGVLTFAMLAGLMWRALRPAGPRVAPTIGETTHGLALRGA
jgi:heme a synthase